MKAAGIIGKIFMLLVILAILYITVQNIIIFKTGMDKDCFFDYKFPFLKISEKGCATE